MTELIPNSYQPLREIRTNQRFSTFEGLLENKKIFVKIAIDAKLKERLSIEANGLKGMKQLDPNEALYHVPNVIELTNDYIATEWAEGKPMVNDFEGGDIAKIELDLKYLVRLYTHIDQVGNNKVDIRDSIQKAVDKSLKNLDALKYQEYIDAELVKALVQYIRTHADAIEARTTHGDLQPGNVMVSDDNKPTIVDCETYRDSWPRHYNIVNFVFIN
jgi:aminoglycoside phosphotransferase (APT) family kinase protein